MSIKSLGSRSWAINSHFKMNCCASWLICMFKNRNTMFVLILFEWEAISCGNYQNSSLIKIRVKIFVWYAVKTSQIMDNKFITIVNYTIKTFLYYCTISNQKASRLMPSFFNHIGHPDYKYYLVKLKSNPYQVVTGKIQHLIILLEIHSDGKMNTW